MDLADIERVAVFCPVSASGGPEALHQLSHALRRGGVDCSMIYTDARHHTHVASEYIENDAPRAPEMLQFYAQYAPTHAARLPWDARSLVILPEGMAHLHRLFGVGKVAIWWLSVDNAYAIIPELRDRAFERELFGRVDLIHLHQSAYARDFLKRMGAADVRELRDYTSPIFTRSPAAAPSAKRICAYNVAKGGDAGDRFFSQHPQLSGLRLQGFSKAQLQEVFSQTRVYIDFGHFPGQDRMPREAAICGAVVFLHRKGAAAVQEDFPLPDAFKFSEEDLQSGELARRVEAVLADPTLAWMQQEDFRTMIRGEQDAFQRQVSALVPTTAL